MSEDVYTHPVVEKLADLRARMVRVEADLAEQRDDLKAIRSALDQAKGGWKTLMLVAGLAGAVGAVMTKIVGFMGALPR